MHYGDKYQKDNQRLKIVIYKHSTSRKEMTPENVHTRGSVAYDLCSIQDCSLFPPHLLVRLYESTYNYVNSAMTPLPFECYYELDIRMVDYDEIEILSITDVSHAEEHKQLH